VNLSAQAEGCQRFLTVFECHYASEHLRGDHPHCEGVPVVAYGSILLCAECDKRRSAVGRTNTPRPIPGVHLGRLQRAADASSQANEALADAALDARRAGASWTQIGRVVGITRQAAQQRWGAAHHARLPASY